MTSSGTTLSVVLPVRNAAPYIGAALASLRRNARPDFEFVVVDDGSDDGTSEIVEDARATLDGLHVLRHDTAVGLASARNAGLAASSGRLITYLDGDDWLAPGYLQELVEAIDGLGCDFVRVDHVQATGLVRVPVWAPEPRRGVVLDPKAGLATLRHSTMIDYPFAWAGVYRRELGDLLEFPAGLHTAEDRPWIWRLHREASSYAVATACGLFYRRQVAQSLTQIGDARQLDFLRSFGLVFDQVRDDPEQYTKAVKQLLVVLASHLRRAERMTPPLVRELRSGARLLLADVPPDVVRRAHLDVRRHLLIHSLLPAEARWRLAG